MGYKKGYFDIIWASSQCTEYPVAKTTGLRDIVMANSIVQRGKREDSFVTQVKQVILIYIYGRRILDWRRLPKELAMRHAVCLVFLLFFALTAKNIESAAIM